MKRIAILSILIEDASDENIMNVNKILHENQKLIMGRMGVPDKVHNINIISIAMLAEEDILNTISGKLGRMKGINAKILYSNLSFEN